MIVMMIIGETARSERRSVGKWLLKMVSEWNWSSEHACDLCKYQLQQIEQHAEEVRVGMYCIRKERHSSAIKVKTRKDRREREERLSHGRTQTFADQISCYSYCNFLSFPLLPSSSLFSTSTTTCCGLLSLVLQCCSLGSHSWDDMWMMLRRQKEKKVTIRGEDRQNRKREQDSELVLFLSLCVSSLE